MQTQYISVTAETIIKAILIGLLFWSVYFFRDLVLVVLTSLVLASAVKPFADWFMRYKVPRVFAVIIVYLILIGGLAGILYFFAPPLLSEMSSLLAQLPEYAELLDVQSFSFTSGGQQQIFGTLSSELPLRESIAELRSALSSLSGGFIQTISTVFGGLFSFILILVLSFYLAVQEKGVDNFFRLVTPVQYEHKVIDLWHRSRKKIGQWMQGQLLLGLIIGVLVFLGLMILGVRYAFLLAVLAGVAELIPLFGPILAALPAVALGFSDGIPLGLMVLGFYVIIQQFENHLIYPLVVRKVVGVSPIVVILSLIIGGKLAGFLGLILAVPVATAALEFLNDWEKEKLAQIKQDPAA